MKFISKTVIALILVGTASVQAFSSCSKTTETKSDLTHYSSIINDTSEIMIINGKSYQPGEKASISYPEFNHEPGRTILIIQDQFEKEIARIERYLDQVMWIAISTTRYILSELIRNKVTVYRKVYGN